MSEPAIDDLPGFRRRFIIDPAPGRVRIDLEDDFHCMSVTLRHEGGVVTAVEPVFSRAPWTTCPGAVMQLQQTFTNVALDAFAFRGEKSANCTHLHDLALLAAAHAGDTEPLVYDLLLSDPIDGRWRAELRRDGATVLSWVHVDGRIIEPAELAGTLLTKMRTWIDGLGPVEQEEARLLRWGTIMGHGRIIPLAEQSDATRMPTGNCYTFQPHIAKDARRVGLIRDFSDGTATPLAEHENAVRAPRCPS